MRRPARQGSPRILRTKCLVLGPERIEGAEHGLACLEVLAKRLLEDDTVGAGGRIVVPLEVAGDLNEDARREGHVEETVRSTPAESALSLDGLDLALKGLECGVFVVRAGGVAGESKEALDSSLAVGRAGAGEVADDAVMEGLFVKLGAGIADDAGVLGQEAEAVQVEEGREGLLAGEVTRRAENDNDGLGRELDVAGDLRLLGHGRSAGGGGGEKAGQRLARWVAGWRGRGSRGGSGCTLYDQLAGPGAALCAE